MTVQRRSVECPSGQVTARKAVYAGSTPASTSIRSPEHAPVEHGFDVRKMYGNRADE